MFDAIYRSARLRVTELARSLSAEQLDRRVAGTPEWTGRQVVAHLVGAAADTVAGNLDGAPRPPWTAAQVRARDGRTLDELIAEWEEAGPLAEAGIAEGRFSIVAAYDVITHEADLRETHGLGRPPAADVETVAAALTRDVLRRFAGPGTLVVLAGGQELTGGEGEPRTVLTAQPYDLLRGLISRRSHRQMLAWQWDAGGGVDLDEMVGKLPVFGPREDDQPVPR